MSRLRGLLGAHRAAAPHARARRQAREPGVRERHRLLEPLPVLHEHLRGAQHPRPCARGRDRHRGGPARPRRVGRHRRRRRSLDRRQPPDPRAAPQRELHDPAVQQPDLRADQGPVLADERAREGHEELAVRLARPPVQPDLASRSAPRRPSSPAPTTWTASTCRRCSGGRTSTRARRSSRSTRTATCSTTVRSRRSSPRTTGRRCSSSCATASRSGSVRTRTRACGSTSTARRRSSTSPRWGRTRCSIHDEHRTDPTVAFALSRLADHPIVPTPVGVFRAVQRPSYESEVQLQLAAAQEQRGPGDLRTLIGGPSVWEVN